MTIAMRELVDAAVDVGLVSGDVVEDVRLGLRRSGGELLDGLMRRCRLPRVAFYRAAAQAWSLPFVDLLEETPEADCLERLPGPILARSRVLPIRWEGDHLLCAAADPREAVVSSSLERLLGRPVRMGLAEPEVLERQLQVLVGGAPSAQRAAIDPVAYLDDLMRQAFLRRASDIHVEPQELGFDVRFRVDGALRPVDRHLPHEQGSALISRVKVLAGLDIAEQRAPQDGGFAYDGVAEDEQSIDVRVATLPTRWGERATLRLLGGAREALTLDALGMTADDIEAFRAAIRKPHGMILLTGPTGSGKTTTLYAALEEIRSPELNLMTVEDPIEQPLAGTAQVQVSAEKISFSGALRAFLRHDPDVLMVGEIRDGETANVALKAAMTGHLLLSSLHTNDACSAVARLRDLGAASYLVGSSLLLVVAQRLVMRLCEGCATTRPATAEEARLLRVDPGTPVPETVGCPRCLGSGFRGRVGLFEFLAVDDELARLIAAEADEGELRRVAGPGLRSFDADARAKVLAGATTLDEARRVVDLRAD